MGGREGLLTPASCRPHWNTPKWPCSCPPYEMRHKKRSDTSYGATLLSSTTEATGGREGFLTPASRRPTGTPRKWPCSCPPYEMRHKKRSGSSDPAMGTTLLSSTTEATGGREGFLTRASRRPHRNTPKMAVLLPTVQDAAPETVRLQRLRYGNDPSLLYH